MSATARVLLAPDKFKGTLTAADVAGAVGAGLHSVRADVSLTIVPVADGGDGTLALALDCGFTPVQVPAADALGNPTTAVIGIRDNHALIELASICGLHRLPGDELRPEDATTIGLGLAVRAALDRGCDRITLGLGGSASTDGGAGLLSALGVRLLDADGGLVAPVPAALLGVATVDLSGLDPRIANTHIEVAIDVDAPLLGPGGAAAVFGPQKGATDAIVRRLEQAMDHWATLLSRFDSRPDPMHPGAGAAGGTAFAALALGAQLVDGADALLDLVDFDTAAADATLVVTGEGRLDHQTLMGKAPVVVARRARRLGVPVVAVVGSRDPHLDDRQLLESGFGEVYELIDVEPAAADDVDLSRAALTAVGARIARTHLSGSPLEPGRRTPVPVRSTSTR